jgi:hypothetical protein
MQKLYLVSEMLLFRVPSLITNRVLAESRRYERGSGAGDPAGK